MSDETLRGDDNWQGPRSEGPGSRIGPFTLLRQIGEGGFGVVFEAEQEQPVKRRVALKVIKLGMDTREVMARFDAERQALAMMDHPHIARVLDAGATDSGRPYFVMELVDGEPIARYCDQHKSSIDQRLRLFEQVCEAVQHAHTKGVIHRDLKPNNVLVSTHDGKPFSKVIDFGIAKATSGNLTDKTLATELNQVVGTPLYMSPEQASGSADIDTRTDIYSLGVILYELLTGNTPVDSATLRSALFAEVQRIICEVEPPLPSARLAQATTTLSGIASQRSTDPRKLTRTVRGELDWIVMKALEKERGRRYETANGLAMDLRRYLAGEPVLAAPPSVTYRIQKFVRRNKGVVAAGSLIAASLLLGIVGFAWQARIAQARADELQQVSNFQADMLGQVDPTEAGVLLSKDVLAKYEAARAKAGVPAAVRAGEVAIFAEHWKQVNATDAARNLIDSTILKPAIAAIDEQFDKQPLVAATLRQVLADRYRDLGLYRAAEPLQESALETRRRALGDEHPDTLRSFDNMGLVLEYQGRLTEAEPYILGALEKRRRVLGEEHPDTMDSINNVGTLLVGQGKLDQAEPYLRQSMEQSRRALGEEHKDTLVTINNLAALLFQQGKLSEAEGYLRNALEKERRVLGEEHSLTLNTIINMAHVLQRQGRLGEAEPYYREALEKDRRVLGEEHPYTLAALSNVGYLLEAQGKLSEAEPFQREALEKRRRVLGNAHAETVASIANLGVLLMKQGKLSEAEAYLREGLETRRRLSGDAHPDTLKAAHNLGELLNIEGKLAEAEPYHRYAMDTSRRVLGEEHSDTLIYIDSMGHFLQAQGKLTESATYYFEALEKRRRVLGEGHPETLISVNQWGYWLTAQGKHAEAVALLSAAEGAARKAFSDGNAYRLGKFLKALGQARTGLGQYAAAEASLLEAHAIFAKTRDPRHADIRECTRALIGLYTVWHTAEPGKGNDAKAAEWQRKLN